LTRIRSVDLSRTKTSVAWGLFVALSGMTVSWMAMAFGLPIGVGCGLVLLSLATRPPRPAALRARRGGTRR
jgi:hypothetical protein